MALFKQTEGFTITPNSLINNENASLKAKGLWTYLQSKPDGWDFSVKGTQKQNKDGYDSVSSGMRELEELGYLKRKPHKDESGQFKGYDYHLYDTPQTENPKPEKPEHGKSVDGEQGDHSNTILSNKELSNNSEENADLFGNKIDVPFLPVDILNYLNKKLKEKDSKKRGFGPVDSNLKDIKARLKDKKLKYTKSDFEAVIDYKISVWWEKDKTKVWLRPSTLFGEKFDQYLSEAMESNEREGQNWGNANFVKGKSSTSDLL